MRHFLYLCSRLQKKQNCFFLGTFIFLTTKNHCEQFIICQKLNKLSFWFATYKVVTLMSSTLNSKCSVMQHLTVWSDRFTVQIQSDFIMSEDSFIHSFILNVYIAPLQENYSEALPTSIILWLSSRTLLALNVYTYDLS